MFVNAATWDLLFTGKLVATHNEAGLSRSLNRILGKAVNRWYAKAWIWRNAPDGRTVLLPVKPSPVRWQTPQKEPKASAILYDICWARPLLTAADAQAIWSLISGLFTPSAKPPAGRGIYEGPGIPSNFLALHPRAIAARSMTV